MAETSLQHDDCASACLLATTFVVAAALNYPWELAQAVLYAEGADFRAMWWHCFVASLGDGVLVLLILAAGWLRWRNAGWFRQPGAGHYALMLGAGLLAGMAVEWVAVHILERWSYTPRMPLLPLLQIGIVPLAQMLLLPPLIFRVVAVWRKPSPRSH